eukprot:TRINITY_DN802_c0_g1_i1.p1 TRINITY_DN802_c0_g1~~TRINITY_DN802_c0_g1_i1.p1  ORF type:complete len:389 (-),score=86.56 TRINITY_DN802_c0_g1_i1:39-1205(-)
MIYNWKIMTILCLLTSLMNVQMKPFFPNSKFFVNKEDSGISEECELLDLKFSGRFFSAQSSNVPSSFNWLNYLNEPNIISLGYCNAYYAMANVYASQLIYQKQFQKQISFSLQSIISCIGKSSCKGGDPFLPWILSSLSPTYNNPYYYHFESDFHYMGSDTIPCPSETILSQRSKIQCWGIVGSSIDPILGLTPVTITDISHSLLEYGPLLTQIKCSLSIPVEILTSELCGVERIDFDLITNVNVFPTVIYGYESIEEELYWLIQIFDENLGGKYKVLSSNKGFGVGGIRSFVATASFDKNECPSFNRFLSNYYNKCLPLFDEDLSPITTNDYDSTILSNFLLFLVVLFFGVTFHTYIISLNKFSNEKNNISTVSTATILDDYERVED